MRAHHLAELWSISLTDFHVSGIPKTWKYRTLSSCLWTIGDFLIPEIASTAPTRTGEPEFLLLSRQENLTRFGWTSPMGLAGSRKTANFHLSRILESSK
jgi:hypothetical protein